MPKTCSERFFGALVGIEQALQIRIVSCETARRLRWRDGELQFEFIDNRARDLVLKRKNTLHFAFESI